MWFYRSLKPCILMPLQIAPFWGASHDDFGFVEMGVS